MNDESQIVIAFVLGVLFCFGLLLPLVAVWLVASPWLKAYLSGAPVSLLQILAMRLRGSPAAMIVETHLALVHGGLASDVRHIESLYIANRPRIVTAADLLDIAKRDLESGPPRGEGKSPAPPAAQALKR